MKLYYSPNACSMAIHVLLHEIGKPFGLQRVDFAQAEQHGAAYKAINPKSKVPALQRDDRTILTELPAIAVYLARTNPALNLWPADAEGEARALEIMEYLIATMHMRGFTRIFRPEAFSPTPEDKEKVQQAGRDFITNGFAVLAPVLGVQDYILGAFSVVDCALFFQEYWAATRASIPMPPAFNAHLARMLARPAVQRALTAEGLSGTV
jgi:glutathione S-transferase